MPAREMVFFPYIKGDGCEAEKLPICRSCWYDHEDFFDELRKSPIRANRMGDSLLVLLYACASQLSAVAADMRLMPSVVYLDSAPPTVYRKYLPVGVLYRLSS